MASLLGNILGIFLEVDDGNDGWLLVGKLKDQSWDRYYKAYRRGIKARFEGLEENSWIPIKYEKLFDFGLCCGTIGHSKKNCEFSISCSKQGQPKVREYGNWLKFNHFFKLSEKGKPDINPNPNNNSDVNEKKFTEEPNEKSKFQDVHTVNNVTHISEELDLSQSLKAGIKNSDGVGVSERLVSNVYHIEAPSPNHVLPTVFKRKGMSKDKSGKNSPTCLIKRDKVIKSPGDGEVFGGKLKRSEIACFSDGENQLLLIMDSEFHDNLSG